MDKPKWDDNIPSRVKEEIGNAVRRQLIELPTNLFIEWHEPKWIEKRWFQDAAKHITIPYYDEYFS